MKKGIFSSMIIACVSLAMISCKQSENKQQTLKEATSGPCNQQCIPEGGEWVSMFDGKTLNGWRGYCKKEVPGGWEVKDGTITFNGNDSKVAPEGGDLIYDKQFKDFVFEIEWKIGKGGNSGIFYTAQEIEGFPIYYSSPEYQLLDNENMPDAWEGVDGNRQAGAVYDMIPPIPQPVNPYDNWNKTKIILYKEHVYHYMNDTLILDYQLGSSVWKALVDKSKFSKFSTDPERCPDAYETMLKCGEKPGYIGLQDHGYGICFRNIRIRELQ